MIKIGNPYLRKLERVGTTETDRATYRGVIAKAIFFCLVTIVSAVGAFLLTNFFLLENSMLAIAFAIVAPILALICGLVAGFVPNTIPVSGTLYTLFEGLAVGFICSIIGIEYGGVVFGALLATMVTFGVMLLLYSTKVIRVTNGFVKFMCTALLGIVIVQLILFAISFIPGNFGEMIYGTGFLSIGISCFMVLFAAFFLLADFKIIQNVVEGGLPKQYEWRASYGLVLTLIWLFLEFLKLFLKLASRNRN